MSQRDGDPEGGHGPDDVVGGVDGARGGWVLAVVLGPERVLWHLAGDAGEVLAHARSCAVLGVDIPMGLPERGRRSCDVEAARRLGSARSSVFPAPVRSVLDQRDHEAACRASRVVTGKAISLQTWNIIPRIREWDRRLLPTDQDRIVEVHPELSFRAMAPSTAFAAKRTARGVGQRLAALRPFVDSGVVLQDLPGGVALDDALDALAAAWSARRWRQGRAEALGEPDEVDGRGLRMRIVV
ncbi:putative nuclease (RNAse H fold) [Streptoalloteichus tenebrarius]|uniref:Nuclease (RNAse H fold) n=1 Tax=Streptoalloteichus tenebrarius (strain ATCC 17920 / DSM 40477 / JCM 4838 / CBS 697.72 / NBRC 16177 / NCIMB 11028 / NRRL B-12390 / A12253. 1 / ISP 5477) TaxID=1933 RepID=A0ABT1HW45_STRSD|nr:DUF429 domain-containing protein [Streptoalloteichus tenebrarius]MCP2259719.1 putative nuclease (RNAse H fold) [Streptoalloteichus tenebrarius]BFF00698.1 DUF429 domain-containing protein [Streptoalloteichus tenebrarius]